MHMRSGALSMSELLARAEVLDDLNGRATAALAGNGNFADPSLRVIADQIRACSFLIADGVLPSNEGRGYVLRRIMRRAMRHGRLLGRTEPFLGETAKVVIDTMETAFPHLTERRDEILAVIEREEQGPAGIARIGNMCAA